MIKRRWLLLIGCFALIVASPGVHMALVFGDDSYEEVSTEGRLFVRGLISSVSIENMQIAVRPLKGKRILIMVGPDTILEEFTGIDELVKKQQVKVWYTAEGDENRAVKVKKMMDLGC